MRAGGIPPARFILYRATETPVSLAGERVSASP